MKKVYCIVIGFTLMALATSSLGYCDDEEGFRWIPYADYDYVMKFKLGRLVSNESDGSLQGFQWLITMGDHYYSPYNKLPRNFEPGGCCLFSSRDGRFQSDHS